MKFLVTIFIALSIANAGFLDSVKENIVKDITTSSSTSTTSNSTTANSATILDTLSNQYNLNAVQSAGAVSSILGYSKSNMSSDNFSSILNSFNLNPLTKSAITSAASSTTTQSSVTSSFEKLGIDSSLISPIANSLIQYYSASSSNTTLTSVLTSSLAGLLQ